MTKQDEVVQRAAVQVQDEKSKRKAAYRGTYRERTWVTSKGKRRKAIVADFGMLNGQRLRETFETISEAENWLREQTLKLQNQGAEAFKLSDSQRLDAIRALSILADMPKTTLEMAAEFFREHNAPLVPKTFNEVMAEYVKEAVDGGLRPRSIQDIEHRLGKFAVVYGDKLIAEITRRDADKWIDSLALTQLSKKHYRTVTGGLFNFAIDKEYIADNPFALKTRRRRRSQKDEKMPECLTWKAVQKAMFTAQDKVPEMVPSLAIGFFAGLRTNEVRQLDWKSIDLESRLITVLPEVAKKRRTRHVTIEQNLVEWLLPYRKDSGLIAPQDRQWRTQFDNVRTLAGLLEKDENGKEKWPDNAMRHSYASHHLLKYNDAAKTALQLGHRDSGVLFDHYRALVKPQDAEKYWQIAPRKEQNLVYLDKAAS